MRNDQQLLLLRKRNSDPELEVCAGTEITTNKDCVGLNSVTLVFPGACQLKGNTSHENEFSQMLPPM